MMVSNCANSQRRVGRLARLRGIDIHANPHAPCTADWDGWQEGWIAADADLQRYDREVKSHAVTRRKRQTDKVLS